MKQQHLKVAGFGLVCCLTVVLSQGDARKEEEPEEINDIDQIQRTVSDMIHDNINIILEDHQIRFLKRGKLNVQVEIYSFFIENGTSFSFTLENTLDASYKPKVVSNVDISDENVQKVLLSLIGGGNIKTASLKKPKKIH